MLQNVYYTYGAHIWAPPGEWLNTISADIKPVEQAHGCALCYMLCGYYFPSFAASITATAAAHVYTVHPVTYKDPFPSWSNRVSKGSACNLPKDNTRIWSNWRDTLRWGKLWQILCVLSLGISVPVVLTTRDPTDTLDHMELINYTSEWSHLTMSVFGSVSVYKKMIQ